LRKPFPFFDRELVLASSSPRRRYLLRLVGIRHTVMPPSVREEDHGDEVPERHVLRLSRLKAESVLDRVTSGLVLGADTDVVLDGEILGKPGDAGEARDTLGRLSGRLHQVLTGITLVDASSGRQAQGFERTLVRIRTMTDREISAYVDTDEPMDKAGSYGIQGYGAAIVERVEGCYFNVVGLPLVRLLHLVRELDDLHTEVRGNGCQDI
jgi:septum formation protein